MTSRKSSRKNSHRSFTVRADWLAQYGASALQRFRSKIIVHNGCWLWTGVLGGHHHDLPLFFLDGVFRSARRVAWHMRHGAPPTHLTVRQTLLTPEQMSEIRLLVAQGLRRADIAQSFGVDLSVIQRVLTNAAIDYLALPKSVSSARSQALSHQISRVSEHERRVLVKLLKQRGKALNARERLVLTRRFGLDGRAPQVLNALIAPVGVTTRERVRQIEERALRKLQLPTQRQALRAKLDQLAQRGG